MQCLVAIHCLVYNHEPYLRDCLEGFVMQKTNFPFVAVIHDDASTDASAAIIREYEEKFPNIIKPIYENENLYKKNKHLLRQIMNAAIDATAAKYVAMCEGDDYWTDPLKLQKQVDFMEANPEYGLCYTDYSICDSEGNLIEDSHYMNGSDKPILTFEEHLFRQGYIAPMTWLYRKDVYESITNNMLKGVSDGSYVVALEFFYHSKVAFLPINTATYRISQGSASRPLSLQGVFKYRKGVYKIEREYAQKYLKSEWIDVFLIRQEIYELYPIAKEINDIEYLDWCHEMALEYPIIDLSIPQLMMRQQKELIQIQSSKAYRLGKSILKPINMIKKLLKKEK